MHLLSTYRKVAYSASNDFRYKIIIYTPYILLKLRRSKKGAKWLFLVGFLRSD
jgi:hypothetical protein